MLQKTAEGQQSVTKASSNGGAAACRCARDDFAWPTDGTVTPKEKDNWRMLESTKISMSFSVILYFPYH